MEQLNEQIEQVEQFKTIEPVEQNETEEQKSKRRVPKYYLVHQCIDNKDSLHLLMFQEKKAVKEYLEKSDIQNLDPILILGHEVPLQFNKIVKVDF